MYPAVAKVLNHPGIHLAQNVRIVKKKRHIIKTMAHNPSHRSLCSWMRKGKSFFPLALGIYLFLCVSVSISYNFKNLILFIAYA